LGKKAIRKEGEKKKQRGKSSHTSTAHKSGLTRKATSFSASKGKKKKKKKLSENNSTSITIQRGGKKQGERVIKGV